MLALRLIEREKSPTSVSIYIDSQATLLTADTPRQKPNQHLILELRKLIRALKRRPGGRRLRIMINWISAHSEVQGNEKADREAKKAAKGSSSRKSSLPKYLQTRSLPANATAVKGHYHRTLAEKWEETWKKSPRYLKLSRIDPSPGMRDYQKILAEISRSQQCLLTQFRTGHVPLNSYLHRIRKAETDVCMECGEDTESIHHFVFECRAHNEA
jgi:stalled ribosome alternative rescue factor ArfA